MSFHQCVINVKPYIHCRMQRRLLLTHVLANEKGEWIVVGQGKVALLPMKRARRTHHATLQTHLIFENIATLQ